MSEPAPPLPPELRRTRSRTLDVAQAYVEGLERDRLRLRELEQNYDRLVWETIQISAYARACYIALHQLYEYTTIGGVLPSWDRIEDLLEADRGVYNEIWSCECGHHHWDHDENGQCEFLACRKICGSVNPKIGKDE